MVVYASFGRRLAGWLLVLVGWLAGEARAQAPVWQSATAVGTPLASTGNAQVYETTTGPDGSFYLVGIFSGTVAFGSTTLTSAGSFDVFVAKWDFATNAPAWLRQAGGPGDDRAFNVAVGPGGVYLAGLFVGATATFGAITLANSTSAGVPDGFVAKLTDAGTWVWVQGLGGTGTDQVTWVAVSGNSLYLTGLFNSRTLALGVTTLTNSSGSSYSDAFVARLTDTGASPRFDWAQQIGGAGNEDAYTVVANSAGVYLTGSFSQNATFGALTLAPSTADDIYVAKLTDASAGPAWAWVRAAGGPGIEQATMLAVQGTSVYAAGTFRTFGTANAGPTFGTTTLSNPGQGDLWVAKLTDAGPSTTWTWARQAGGTTGLGLSQVWGLQADGPNVYIAGTQTGTSSFFGTAPPAGAGTVFVSKLTDLGSSATFGWAQRGGGAGTDTGFALTLLPGRLCVSGYVAPPATFGPVGIPASAGQSVAFLTTLTDANILSATVAGVTASVLAIYPNPAHHIAQVVGAPAGGILYNAFGQAVKAIAPTQTTLDLTNLPAGMYVFKTGQQHYRLALE